MKRISCVFTCAIVFGACVLTQTTAAQTGIAGRWHADSPSGSTLTLVLRVNGPKLTGASDSCASGPIPISEGNIDGNTITFKCKSLDGDRTLTLTGEVNGDEIAFEWELQVRDGGAYPAARNGLFGSFAPRRFIAKRIPDRADDLAELADRSSVGRAVTFDVILHADREPQNWLTYSGSLLGQRYSPLTQITPTNVRNLKLAWIWQSQSTAPNFQATPLVVDGVLYTVQAPNEVVALDAATGRKLWTYPYTPNGYRGGSYRVNRGLAILGDALFMGTVDAHLLAINAYSGKLLWNTTVADAADPACKGRVCYSITHAPLVLKDKVIVGTAGGEGSTRGFIAAFDVTTGKEVWRFSTIPLPGEPGNETWSGDSWKTGGAPVWNTGSYDPDLNLTYWGIGNPSPNEEPSARLGDNLYSDSVVALDAGTGKLKWYYQFTPHDDKDWDSTQVPVLTDMDWKGRQRKVMLWANRNGLMYVLDRTTGEFLMGKPFVEVNWLSGFDDKGRPVRVQRSSNTPVMPIAEGTNWYPPSYSPNTGLFYIPAWEESSSPRYSAVRAFDPRTGEKKWEFKEESAIFRGVLTTASDLLFTGVLGQGAAGRLVDGQFYALDARTGQLLWPMSLPGPVQSGPISYSVSGKQYIAVAAGNTLFAFALRQ